ncbi:MAG: ABC transporter ATP-binding protein [Roseinatronobacter sp.]
MEQSPVAAPPDEIMQPADTVGWRSGLAVLWRVIRLSMRTPWQAAAAILATLIASGMQLLIPLLLGQAVDQTQALLMDADAARSALLVSALLVLLVSVLRGAFTTAQNYYSEAVGHHVGYQLRLSVYKKIQALSFGFHDRVHSGDLITLGMLDLEGVRMFFSTGLVRVVLLSMLLGIGATILISTDVVLGLLALSFVPFVAWRSSVSQLRLRKTWLDLQERLSVLSRVMEENLAGIRVVRAFAAQPHEMGKYRKASANALELAHERVQIRVKNTAAMTFSFLAAMGLVLWVGAGKVAAGDITVGTLASFLTFMTILQMPVRQLGMLVNSFARTATCGARLFALLDLELAIKDAPDAKPLQITDGTLRFESVDFAYPGARDKRRLSQVSFTARRGETIGIMGAPGSGKSTLAHLIPRFHDVTGGRITIDGQDVRDVTLHSLRQAVSVVQQDVFLFTTTLENNIAYGDPWAQTARIARAGQAAQMHQFIDSLPLGYGTIVGERGSSLSGGQRQRMSIARTLLLDPAVLVFDDSTAAIDARTEEAILAEIQTRAADRVTLIIAHRLNSLRHADRILFLEDGAIVEQGTHAELMAMHGRYRALHDLQNRPAGPRPDSQEAR